MKVSRSYLLGLGSGLILSALISMIIPATGGISGQTTSVQGSGRSPISPSTPATESTSANENNKATGGSGVSSSPSQTTNQEATGTSAKSAFVIPPGASAEKIAELLQSEGWISNKEDFLSVVKRKKLETRFQAGTYPLVPGLSSEEIANRLIH